METVLQPLFSYPNADNPIISSASTCPPPSPPRSPVISPPTPQGTLKAPGRAPELRGPASPLHARTLPGKPWERLIYRLVPRYVYARRVI